MREHGTGMNDDIDIPLNSLGSGAALVEGRALQGKAGVCAGICPADAAVSDGMEDASA